MMAKSENTLNKNEGHLLATDDPQRTADIKGDINVSKNTLSHPKTGGNPIIIEHDAAGERFVQIGVTALRDPVTGDFLPAEPMYVKVSQREIGKTGFSQGEENVLNDIAAIAAETIGRYIKSGGLCAGAREVRTCE